MGRYINPFTDWGFKLLFGQEANKDILIFFLNELLRGEKEITDLEFLDKEQLGISKDDRSLIYDVYCKTTEGDHIIVEMQNKSQSSFLDRSLYYVSRAIVAQGEKGGDWDYKLTPVYGVFFMNFKLPPRPDGTPGLKPKLRTDFALTELDTGEQVLNKMRMIYLQLPYFTKGEDECENDFERIIYVLKKMEVLERMPFEKRNFIFTKLAEIAEVRKLSPDERVAYDQSLKHYRDTTNIFATAIGDTRAEALAEGRAEGRAEGLAEGEAIGIAKGEARGLAKGRAEGRAEFAEEIALNMIAKGFDSIDIQQMTGLSDEVIKRLAAKGLN